MIAFQMHIYIAFFGYFYEVKKANIYFMRSRCKYVTFHRKMSAAKLHFVWWYVIV